MLMDTRQLAAFCAVVERKSFSQAAERLGVTQPAVSLQVRSLEKRLGRKLLDRSGRRVEPTEAGLALYRGAQRLLSLEGQLLEELEARGEGELGGTLEVGASTGPGSTVVPVLLCEFQRENPGVAVSLSISDTQSVVERVAARELELGVVGAARRPRGVVFEPFFRDEVVLAVPPPHRFANRTVAIDLAKAVSAATALPLVSVPTTYSGAEWTDYFGVRDPARRMRGGGAGAHLAGIVYEPELTLSLPKAETVGTALNALAHCAEALYVKGRNEEADREALDGARWINYALPQVVEDGQDLDRRTKLLAGAESAGRALALAGLGLGHAMAQALGGRYGLPHGALNAICLPAALRFNEPAAPEALRKLSGALGT